MALASLSDPSTRLRCHMVTARLYCPPKTGKQGAEITGPHHRYRRPGIHHSLNPGGPGHAPGSICIAGYELPPQADYPLIALQHQTSCVPFRIDGVCIGAVRLVHEGTEPTFDPLLDERQRTFLCFVHQGDGGQKRLYRAAGPQLRGG